MSERKAGLREFWAGLIGALVGGVFALSGTFLAISAETDRQAEAFKETREREARDLRRPAYTEFLRAADAYATAVKQARDCEAAGAEECGLSTTVQQARYEMQGAINGLYAVATPEAIDAKDGMMIWLPPTLVGVTGQPELEPFEESKFISAYRVFSVVSQCDTNPDRRPDCP
ncbi:hypothetical protein M768_13845 [Cellulosimicrobium cellulans F16]|uniref:Uncharacterized protein n=1 Tax=Cellulosimicrobium cellulans F16 TaxID=1350482 RepID=A0A0M0F4T2_CELCE|nr:hypothetical protein [Cellulosimicrobium cellulans]KON72585.1 hypothetical protein M768_13845 [Cellulosimicrobium cellulans F16]